MTLIPWQTYKGRRKLNLSQTMKENNLKTYEQVVQFFLELHVDPPSSDEVENANATVTTETKSTKTSTTRKTTTRKKTATKNAEIDAPDEMWQDGLEGAYQTKLVTPWKACSIVDMLYGFSHIPNRTEIGTRKRKCRNGHN